LAGCTVLPADNVWNTPIDTLPVHPSSAAFINTIGASATVHADFGSGLWEGGPIGIPYTTVPGTQPRVPIRFDYDDESDPGPYPIPTNAPIEGGPQSDGDRHVLVLDRDSCVLYEVYDAFPHADGSWDAGSGAIFNLGSNALRPATWTSADAAGLPLLPGLVRYDEVAAGEIRHAVRFTAPQTRREFIWPARHYASSLTGSQYPPMGLRVRLKAGVNIGGYPAEVQVILLALKRYGMLLADNGSPWYLSGVPDERWDNDVLHTLRQLRGSDFEAVDASSLMVHPDSAQVRLTGQPTATTVPPTASPPPSATRTATASRTPSRTPTRTPTRTRTATRTPTRTPAPTRTRRPRTTPSPTPQPSATPTPTATATPATVAVLAGEVRVQARTDWRATEILVDGVPGGTTASNGRFVVRDVAPGMHTVQAKRQGALASRTTVQVAAGQVLDLGATRLLAGEVYPNGRIDGLDVVLIAAAAGRCAGQTSFQAWLDLDADGCVTAADVAIAQANMGRTGPTGWTLAP
jgi:hypothetical protein